MQLILIDIELEKIEDNFDKDEINKNTTREYVGEYEWFICTVKKNPAE